MLDFYYINDGQQTLDDDNGKLEFAGSLNADVFHNLKKKGVIDQHFNYYSDFRWSETLLKQMHQNIKLKYKADGDIHLLFQLVDSAVERKTGLVAFGD